MRAPSTPQLFDTNREESGPCSRSASVIQGMPATPSGLFCSVQDEVGLAAQDAVLTRHGGQR